ncbi:MAG: PilZ domain-containing protein [Holophagales bacterium]|jgi:hypothetical protein|nr:PilZ domain-containing protein [Holophagales bacterium]
MKYFKLMADAGNKKEYIRSIFEEACARRELLVLVTKYLKFKSNFVHLNGDVVHARTTTGGEDALKILDVRDLGLRFHHPFKPDFLEASTMMLGLGFHEGFKTITFALPATIYANDGRKAPRIKLENAHASFNLRGRWLIRANVIDLSYSGARLALTESLPRNELRVNDRIMVSIYLPDGDSINNGAIIRHMENKDFGIEFNPELPDSLRHFLSTFALINQEKQRELMAERELIAGRIEQSAEAAMADAKKREKTDECGILFVTRDDGLNSALNEALGEDRKFYRIVPIDADLLIALSQKPQLVILHASNSSTAERRLLKSLAEIIPWEIPTLLLGTDIENEVLFEIKQECNVVASALWTPRNTLFLQRLVLGILRRYYGSGESPMAPA